MSPLLKDKRIRIITGYYGSGKTEFALQYSLQLAKHQQPVYLADLDIINVYFRSREKERFLNSRGIEILGNILGSDIIQDIPHVSANIYKPLHNHDDPMIIDLAGSEVGVNILALIKKYLTQDNYDMFCIINVFREETKDAEHIIDSIQALQKKSGLRITGLINNANLIHETTMEHIEQGNRILTEVEEAMNIPIRYVMIPSRLLKNITNPIKGDQLVMSQIIMREKWQ